MLKTPHYSCYGQSFKMILDLSISHPSFTSSEHDVSSTNLQEASHPSDALPAEDHSAEHLHSNNSCPASISNNMADNIEKPLQRLILL